MKMEKREIEEGERGWEGLKRSELHYVYVANPQDDCKMHILQTQ